MNHVDQKTEVSAARARLVLSLMDLTSLNDDDTPERIRPLCEQAIAAVVPVAAVCVYPAFVSLAADLLRASTVRVATVVNFPSGSDEPAVVFAALVEAIQHGAHEIDVVFPYERYFSGDVHGACDFISQCKALCGSSVLLKVILETGRLQTTAQIAELSDAAIVSGADFIKTSTGKSAVGATLEAAAVMLSEIQKAHHPVGLKVSGGVRTLEQAGAYLDLVEDSMGAQWVSAKTLRFGASQLWAACQATLA